LSCDINSSSSMSESNIDTLNTEFKNQHINSLKSSINIIECNNNLQNYNHSKNSII
jgi:hypothetical protein